MISLDSVQPLQKIDLALQLVPDLQVLHDFTYFI